MNGILDDLANLPKMLSSKAKSLPLQAAANLTSNFDATQQRYEKKIDEAATKAEVYLAATLGLQAIASFAALGVMIYSIKNYNRGARRSSSKKRGGRR